MRAGWWAPTSTTLMTLSGRSRSNSSTAPEMSSARRKGAVGWSIITASYW